MFTFKKDIHTYLSQPGPFAVMKLSTSTEENSIMVIWDKPHQYKDSYRFNVTWQKSDVHSVVVKETQYKIPDLVPGSSYNIRVTTETSDGTEGEPTLVSSCTSMIVKLINYLHIDILKSYCGKHVLGYQVKRMLHSMF